MNMATEGTSDVVKQPKIKIVKGPLPKIRSRTFTVTENKVDACVRAILKAMDWTWDETEDAEFLDELKHIAMKALLEARRR